MIRLALMCVWLVAGQAGWQLAAAESRPESAEPGPRPRVGLVLSGGGARGAAHIGVIKVLERSRVPVDAISGTSMGAVVGGLYASGLSAAELEAEFDAVDWTDVFDDETPRADLTFRRKQDAESFLVDADIGLKGGQFVLPRGLIQGQKLNLTLRRLTLPVSHIADFDELPIPLRAVATDIETGESIVMAGGDLATAIRASMAAPGVFAPVEVGGRLLVDGGVAANLPVQVMKQMNVDVLIVVDAGFPLLGRDELGSALAVTGQMLTVMIRREAQAQKRTLAPQDVLIEPPLGDLGSTDFQRLDEAIALGEQAAEAFAGRFAALALSEPEYEHRLTARRVLRRPPPTIDFIHVLDNSKLSERMLKGQLATKAGRPLDVATVTQDVARLYGLASFEGVDYRLLEEEGRHGVEFHARRKSWGPNYVRFGLNLQSDLEGASTFNVAARYTMTELNALGGEWRNDGQIGNETLLFSEFYQPVGFGSRYFVAPQISLDGRTIEVFRRQERIGEYRVTTGSVGLDIGRELGNWGELRFGVRTRKGSAHLRTGDLADPALQDFDFDADGLFFRFAYDRIDDPNFPRSGTRARLEWDSASEDRGTNQSFDLLSSEVLSAHSRGRSTYLIGSSLGTTLQSEGALQDFFTVGGFLNLSGLRPGARSGPHYGVLRSLYYRQIAGDGPFGVPVYVGASLEAGNVWQEREDIALDDLLWGGGLFLGADTLFGPLYTGVGLTEGGHSAFYLFLGQTFSRPGIRRP